jgi:hypothetical protein
VNQNTFNNLGNEISGGTEKNHDLVYKLSANKKPKTK